MKDLRGTYVHRGDVERRRRKIRAGFMIVGLLLAGTVAARSWEPNEANAASTGADHPAPHGAGDDKTSAFAPLQRWHDIDAYARRYHISLELAQAIYDAAVAERIDPALAFPLVRLESQFHERATSSVGAIGLTQLMLPTARFYAPGITRQELYNRDLNLHIGFRYLRDLLERYGDVRLALLVYNRGPVAVAEARKAGVNPSNGYDRIVMRGYRGKGLIGD